MDKAKEIVNDPAKLEANLKQAWEKIFINIKDKIRIIYFTKKLINKIKK